MRSLDILAVGPIRVAGPVIERKWEAEGQGVPSTLSKADIPANFTRCRLNEHARVKEIHSHYYAPDRSLFANTSWFTACGDEACSGHWGTCSGSDDHTCCFLIEHLVVLLAIFRFGEVRFCCRLHKIQRTKRLRTCKGRSQLP
jgi:hypothetical protein